MTAKVDVAKNQRLLVSVAPETYDILKLNGNLTKIDSLFSKKQKIHLKTIASRVRSCKMNKYPIQCCNSFALPDHQVKRNNLRNIDSRMRDVIPSLKDSDKVGYAILNAIHCELFTVFLQAIILK
mgnify:CR=1 FL=1